MSITPSNYQLVPTIRKDYILSLLKDGKRVDGRGPSDVRPISIITNYVPRADGSAYVKLGETIVLTGVKIEPGTPYPDNPSEGVLIVNAEFVPLASPLFEPGPPDENAYELARVIDRSFRESKAINLSKLGIVPGKKVMVLWTDIYVLNHNGNLIDASAISTLAALLTTKVPKVVINGEQVILEKSSDNEFLEVNKKVVTATVAKIGSYLVVDPNDEEESIADVRLSVSFDEHGEIVGLQKSGMGFITPSELDNMVDLAWRAANIYLKEINEQLAAQLSKPREEKEVIIEKLPFEKPSVDEESAEEGQEEEKQIED
jgi:exosome complex component RRP42